MKVVFRADAYRAIGTGHIMRCLALAQGCFEAGASIMFLGFIDSERLSSRIEDEGFELLALPSPEDEEGALGIIKTESPDWVILDGYHFRDDFQQRVRDAGPRVLVLDDFAHLNAYHADILVNQNYGAGKFVYSTDPDTKLLLGTDYILLRREFLQVADRRRIIPEHAEKVLVTMGGTDSENFTLRVLKALEQVKGPLQISVIAGAGNPNIDSLETFVQSSKHLAKLIIDVRNMVKHMAWADVAISAGGSTVWELAFMGLPSLLCIIADNQTQAVRALKDDGLFLSAENIIGNAPKEIKEILDRILTDAELRQSLSQKLRWLVDGKGIDRVITAIKSKS